jgi:hypothetical protein
MVAVTYHSEFYLFTKRLKHVGRNGLVNIAIQFHPVMTCEITGNYVRIGWVKNQSGVMLKSKVFHDVEGGF